MALTSKYVTNKNFLTNLQSEFWIRRLPNVGFFCQRVVIPGVFMKAVHAETPIVDIKHPGDQVYFNEFQVTFLVDEYMTNYLEILDWIYGLGSPESTDQHQALSDKTDWAHDGISSDATLIILDSKSLPKLEVELVDCFPVSLSDLEMDVRGTRPDYVTATASFAYTSYKIKRLNTSA